MLAQLVEISSVERELAHVKSIVATTAPLAATLRLQLKLPLLTAHSIFGTLDDIYIVRILAAEQVSLSACLFPMMSKLIQNRSSVSHS